MATAVTPGKGNFITVDGFVVFFDQSAGDTIHLITDNPAITDEHGLKPGLRVAFSSNPNSANYNPSNFNRLARLLAAHGKPAPAEVPLHPRHLAKRDQVKKALGAKVVAPSADLGALGLEACPECYAVVTSLEGHGRTCAAA